MNIRQTAVTNRAGRIASRILPIVAVLLPILAQAQTDAADGQPLTLFEAVETPGDTGNSPSRPTRESRATTAEPEFTLIGTSRIGERQSAMLRHKSGEMIVVNTSAGNNAAISDYVGYSLVDLGAGSVSIRYPANNPCEEFADKGVRCNDAGNIAELVLSNGEPLAATNRAANPATENPNGNATGDVAESTTGEPTNPFEALRAGQAARAAAGQDGNPNGNRFTPRRINPEDVPPGMRIVSTPFGDRLVEQ